MRFYGLFSVVITALALSCGANTPPSQMQDEWSGLNFFYYDKADRLKVLDDFKSEIEARYSLLAIKKERLSIDHEALFAATTAEIAASADPGNNAPQEQAASNMAYLDSVKKLVAGFQDTHFGVGGLVRRPSIVNGLKLAEVNGRFYVIALSKKILAYTAARSMVPYAEKIELGDEVVAIDGVAVDEAVRALMPYEASSSLAFARAMAVEALTLRNYRYPEKSYSDFEFRSPVDGSTAKIRLDWYYDAQKNRRDAIALLKSRGMEGTREITETFNTDTQTWEVRGLGWTGYDEFSEPYGAIGAKTYLNAEDPTETVIRTGYLIQGGKTYGFLQIFTYMMDQVIQNQGETPRSWAEPVAAFVQELKANQTPLVIDIRRNGGGNTAIPPQVLSLVAKKDEKYASIARGYRITRYIRQLVDMWNDEAHPNLNNPEWTVQFGLVDEAVANRWTHTKFYSNTSDITASPTVGGYELPIVLMTSPHCISSCDIQTFLFKGSKRATILGTHSNGTGAGYTSSDPFTSSPWSDRFSILRTSIPNFLFGYSGRTDTPVNPELDGYMQFNTENVPTQADVQYHDTVDDYLKQGKDWYSRAIEILSGQR